MERSSHQKQAQHAAYECQILADAVLVAMSTSDTALAQNLATQLRHTTGDLVFFLKCVNEEKK